MIGLFAELNGIERFAEISGRRRTAGAGRSPESFDPFPLQVAVDRKKREIIWFRVKFVKKRVFSRRLAQSVDRSESPERIDHAIEHRGTFTRDSVIDTMQILPGFLGKS